MLNIHKYFIASLYKLPLDLLLKCKLWTWIENKLYISLSYHFINSSVEVQSVIMTKRAPSVICVYIILTGRMSFTHSLGRASVKTVLHILSNVNFGPVRSDQVSNNILSILCYSNSVWCIHHVSCPQSDNSEGIPLLIIAMCTIVEFQIWMAFYYYFLYIRSFRWDSGSCSCNTLHWVRSVFIIFLSPWSRPWGGYKMVAILQTN